MTKEQKYDILIEALNHMFVQARFDMLSTPEPKWPDHIVVDYIEVNRFQKDVHDHAFAQSYFATMNHIVNFVLPNLEHLTTTKAFEEG